MASVAPDAAVPLPPDAAAAVPVPALAPAARAPPAANTSPRDAASQHRNAPITADVSVLPASQESDMSASSCASYAPPPLLSSQSNVSTESIVDTELTSPATSNVSSQCPPFAHPGPLPVAANQDHVAHSPSRAVTPQPAAATATANASSASPMAVDTPTTIPQGTKRTASGAMKLPTSSAGLISAGICSGVPSANSMGALSSLSRIGKLSADLKTRLSYAMIKVQNGWEHQSIEELETTTTTTASQRTSRSATQTPTSAKFRNATDSPHAYDRRRRPSALSDPSDRYLGTPGAQRSPSGIRTFGPTGFAHMNASTHELDAAAAADDDEIDLTDNNNTARRRPSTASTLSSSASSAPSTITTALAPALDLSPSKRHRRSMTTGTTAAPPRPPPWLGSQPRGGGGNTKPFTDVASPATPAGKSAPSSQQQQQRPVGILRMPSQQAEMDAVDSLLFMSSPNNSAHLAHTSSAAAGGGAGAGANPSPLKATAAAAVAAKKVAFDERGDGGGGGGGGGRGGGWGGGGRSRSGGGGGNGEPREQPSPSSSSSSSSGRAAAAAAAAAA